MAVRRFLAVGLAAALAGCEWITGIGDKTLVASDAGRPGQDAAPPSPSEGGPPPDDAAPSAPCAVAMAAGALFCEDFDRPGENLDVSTGVTSNCSFPWNTLKGGGTIDSYGVDYTSAPYSARFTEPAGAGDMQSNLQQAQLGVTNPPGVAGLQKELRVAFDLRLDVDALAGMDDGQVGIIQLDAVVPGTMTTTMSYFVVVESDGLHVFPTPVGETQGDLLFAPSPPLRTWMRVDLLYQASGGLTVTLDGAPTGVTNAPVANAMPGTVAQFIVGAVYSYSLSGALAIEMDNIVMFGQ